MTVVVALHHTERGGRLERIFVGAGPGMVIVADGVPVIPAVSVLTGVVRIVGCSARTIAVRSNGAAEASGRCMTGEAKLGVELLMMIGQCLP